VRSLHAFLATLAGRFVAGLLALATALVGCPPPAGPLPAQAGLPQYQELAALRVPGGLVNAIGGNLHLRRVDLSIETRLGTREVGAVYDSASGAWLWDFDVRYDGALFLDPTGARHETGSLAPGSAVPGTVWVVVDGDSLRTKGGLVHDFDADGRLAAIHWRGAAYPRLTTTSQTLAGEPRITKIRQCTASASCSDVFTMAYDAAGRLVSITDRAGRQASFTWDGEGRLVAARDALDAARGWPGFRYEYAGADLTALTNSEDERVEFAYAGGRISRVRAVGEGDPELQLAYEGRQDGLYRTRVTDALGAETRYRYDAHRRLHEVENMASGDLTVRTWSGRRVASEIRPDGVATSWSYAGDDVATRVEPSGNVVSYVYSPHGVDRDAPLERPIASVSDSLGLVEQRGYDAAGRLVSVTNGAGETVGFGWGSDGLVETVTTPDGVVRWYLDRAEHGRAERLRLGDVEQARRFDAVGNLLEGPSDDFAPLPGGLVERAFDEDRNLAGVRLAELGAYGTVTATAWITIEHRSDGRRTAIRRPGGGDHELVYDALGRLVAERERVDGAWRTTTHEWDAAGRPTAVERPNGMREELEWDAGGRIVARRALRSGVLEGSAELGWQAGRLVSLDDSLAGGGESYAYDSAGRLLSVRHPGGEQLFFGWDARSRRTREIYLMPDWSVLRELEFAYDLADREVSISDQGAPVLERTWQGGRNVRTSYGNGLVRSFEHDPTTGLLLGSSTVDGALELVEETTIERESSNSLLVHLGITATTSTWGGVDATSVERYGLAPLANDPWVDSGTRVWLWGTETGTQQTFAYDPLGNVTSTGLGAHPFAYNFEGNRLLAANPHGTGLLFYTWDAAGFATSRAGRPIHWTATGRLASYGDDVELEWDMQGRLLHSRVEGVESRFRFGGRVRADASGAPLSLDLGEVAISLGDGTHLYRHLDLRENVKFVTDDAGEVVAHYRYGPYGLDHVFGSDQDPVRFVGRAEIGELAILGFRVYDPAVGRFLSPDPLLQVENQYAYALGNPVLFTDPDGRQVEYGALVGFTLASIALALSIFALLTLSTLSPGFIVFLSAAEFGIAGFEWANAAARLIRAQEEKNDSEQSLAMLDGCSPARLTAVPEIGRAFWLLAGAQILLLLLVLRRRRRPAARAERP
jgi:RHS repeat-associated protein